jgi:Holliday junction DNA helicase RuvA
VIAHLKGVVLEKNATEVIVDVNGVGYRVAISILALSRLPEKGAEVSLRIRTVVREDALDLYGFLSAVEEDLFLQLTSVSHVGPKMGIAVLSGLEVDELIAAIAKGDVARLTKIHGVGKKTAERLVLELKDKMKLLGSPAATTGKTVKKVSSPKSDLVSALMNLGYKEGQAEQAAQLAEERAGADAAFELQFREALKSLRG